MDSGTQGRQARLIAVEGLGEFAGVSTAVCLRFRAMRSPAKHRLSHTKIFRPMASWSAMDLSLAVRSPRAATDSPVSYQARSRVPKSMLPWCCTAYCSRRTWRSRRASSACRASSRSLCLIGTQVAVRAGAGITARSARVTRWAPQWVSRRASEAITSLLRGIRGRPARRLYAESAVPRWLRGSSLGDGPARCRPVTTPVRASNGSGGR